MEEKKLQGPLLADEEFFALLDGKKPILAEAMSLYTKGDIKNA